MTDTELLHAIHSDVREIRANQLKVIEQLNTVAADHDARIADLEEHVSHNGPTKWDVGTMLTAFASILYDWLVWNGGVHRG